MGTRRRRRRHGPPGALTLGSPQHGTNQAALGVEFAGSCPAACEQLVPDSDLLRRLNAGDETPAGPLWATIRSTTDQVVTPVDSAALSGALNIVVQDVCRARPLLTATCHVILWCWPRSTRCWALAQQVPSDVVC